MDVGNDGTDGDDKNGPAVDQERRVAPSQTIGVGSAIAIGCTVALILFVLLALLVRSTTGAW